VGNRLSKHIRILVVDDNAGARESLKEILEDDFDVECVEDGASALERVMTTGEAGGLHKAL